MKTIGLDIGGANLKVADQDGRSVSRSFPLWKTPERLASELSDLLRPFQPFQRAAVTMTGELADCFTTKAEGVEFILSAVETAVGAVPMTVWQTGAEFLTPDVAREIPLLVAAANWHALATWVGRMVPTGVSLLIDIGSTTTDLIPLYDGVPIPQGLTDRERLQSGELVYSGVRRTPLCALSSHLPFRGAECPVAAELFATTLDVYLLRGDLPEDPSDCDTANGKPATQDAAHNRLARMLCCDRHEFTREDADAAAAFLADVQQQQLARALAQVLNALSDAVQSVLISGSGSFLARRIILQEPRLSGAKTIALSELFTPELAEAACAFAVARLAAERG